MEGFFLPKSVVLYYMSSRKCIYTGKDANCKDKVIPHDGGDINHNWANTVPCSREYKETKGKRFPTEAEFLAAKAFYLEELAKMEKAFYEGFRGQLMAEVFQNDEKVSKSDTLEVKKPAKVKKKEKEIAIAIKQKEIEEVDLSEVLEKKKNRIVW